GCWNQSNPSRLEARNIVTFEVVDDVQAALLSTRCMLGRLDHYWRELLDGDTMDLAFLPQPDVLERALLLSAMDQNLEPYRACFARDASASDVQSVA
ncbi:MAG TPA: hypothetical protein VKU60_13775, partial [Chloroflexota bacterium]|nr:hypothetical protein [Chloroflexota bacterium]